MKLVALSYYKLENIEMEKVDRILLEISGEETIKKAIQAEPKLKSTAMYLKLKGQFKEGDLEKIALNMEEYFNLYKVLGNHFLENHSKKYEELAKKFVALDPEEYEEFLHNNLKIENDLALLLTMIRFLKQNDSYSEQINYLLQGYLFETKKANKLIGVESKLKMTDENTMRGQMHKMLDEIFSLMGDPEEIAALKVEIEKNIKKVKSVEKKLAGQTKELEMTKQNLIQERGLLKDARTTISMQNEKADNHYLEMQKLQKAYDAIQQELVIAHASMDKKVTSHKNELKSLEERYKKKLEAELAKVTDEKSNLQLSNLNLNETVAELTTSNNELQEVLSRNNTEKEALIVQIGMLKDQLNAVSTNETYNTSPTQSKQTAISVNSSVQNADSELLKSVGFGSVEMKKDAIEDESDLFDIDENVPSFD